MFIFRAHYVLFGFGQSSTVVLLTLFLRTYAPETSLFEVGLLLMLLPFISILVKPLFCALADRQRAHKQYLMASLALNALGFGLLIVPTFLPHLIESHARLLWYFYATCIVVGYSAYAVVFSLGDALAINAAAKDNTPWGTIRAYATASWGIGGWCIGFVNESPYMPAYVPGLLINSCCLLLELLLILCWPKSQDFDMSLQQDQEQSTNKKLDNQSAVLDMNHQPGFNKTSLPASPAMLSKTKQQLVTEMSGEGDEFAKTNKLDMAHDFVGDSFGRANGSSLNLRMVAAIGKLVANEVGSSLRLAKGSAAMRGQLGVKQRKTINELIGQEEISRARSRASSRSSMARQTTLGASSGLSLALGSAPGEELRKAALEACRQKDDVSLDQHPIQFAIDQQLAKVVDHDQELANDQPGCPDDVDSLQLVLLKIIIRRNPAIIKNLLVFVLMGMLLFIHLIYFFMHAEIQCRKLGLDFSQVAGYYLLAHTFSEVFSFVLVSRYYMPFVGRTGSFVTAGCIFLFRYTYYATYFAHYSPYWAIITECSHGFAYGIAYTLMSELARESVDQLDEYMPELVALGLAEPGLDPDQLKVPLRATMQGIFSGAFDGLGNGLGVVVAGVCLDHYPYEVLWALCSIMALVLTVGYPLTEIHRIVKLDGWFVKRKDATSCTTCP